MRIARAASVTVSFVLSASIVTAVTVSTVEESFNSARLAVALSGILALQALRMQRLVFSRETGLYAALTFYMALSLIWTRDAVLGLNTLFPACDCILLMILFGALVTFHSVTAVLGGAVCGFLVGAVYYTRVSGFPMAYPLDFSYNAVAGMYLCGLILTICFSWVSGVRLIPLGISLACVVLIAATTSIKTNVGIVLGAVVASIAQLRTVSEMLLRNAAPLIVLAGAIAFTVFSSPALQERVEAGIERVGLGVDVLRARDDSRGDTSFDVRRDWKDEGIKGWARNPIFGHGVEAFRADHDITSHSTPIDLLYNFGVIGLALYYSVLGSIAWRVFIRRNAPSALLAIVGGAVACYAFMSLSATLHYNYFVAAFVGVTVPLLRRYGLDEDMASERSLRACRLDEA